MCKEILRNKDASKEKLCSRQYWIHDWIEMDMVRDTGQVKNTIIQINRIPK
jgi:hypothetical protein